MAEGRAPGERRGRSQEDRHEGVSFVDFAANGLNYTRADPELARHRRRPRRRGLLRRMKTRSRTRVYAVDCRNNISNIRRERRKDDVSRNNLSPGRWYGETIR